MKAVVFALVAAFVVGVGTFAGVKLLSPKVNCHNCMCGCAVTGKCECGCNCPCTNCDCGCTGVCNCGKPAVKHKKKCGCCPQSSIKSTNDLAYVGPIHKRSLERRMDRIQRKLNRGPVGGFRVTVVV